MMALLAAAASLAEAGQPPIDIPGRARGAERVVVATVARVEPIALQNEFGDHEFGHALGLGHSTVFDATMYPSYSYCSQALRTLAPDDLAGVVANEESPRGPEASHET